MITSNAREELLQNESGRLQNILMSDERFCAVNRAKQRKSWRSSFVVHYQQKQSKIYLLNIEKHNILDGI